MHASALLLFIFILVFTLYAIMFITVHDFKVELLFYLTNLFGSMYIYITHLKARSKTARYERDSLKSSHARHLPASNYMIICTVIYLYTHSIHIRTLTDKAHRDGLHTLSHRQVTHRRLKAISHRSRPARAILSCEKCVLLSWRVREHSGGQK